MQRRDFLKLSAGAGITTLPVFGQHAAHAQVSNSSLIKPIWLSFGINGPAEGATRFPLTLGLSNVRVPNKPDFQLQVSQAIASQLKAVGDITEFKDSAEFNSGVMLGAVLDYENVLSARVGAASFIVLHLVGHGVLLNFDRQRGWKMLSSFPFPVTLLRESQGGDAQTEASRYLLESYTGNQISFATSFAKAAKRLAPRWKDSDRGFHVRVMSSSIAPDVQAKLKTWGIVRNIGETWLGHLTSAAICEGLNIPVIPYVETQALGNFTYKFSDRLIAQNVRLPEEADIDLRLQVTLRNIVRDVKYRNQYQRWEVSRAVVLDVKALDDRNEELVSLRMGYQDDQPDTLAREEDLVPARDAHFFDMAIYRGLLTLFSAIDKQDQAQLGKVFVKPNAEQQKRIDRFRNQYQKAI